MRMRIGCRFRDDVDYDRANNRNDDSDDEDNHDSCHDVNEDKTQITKRIQDNATKNDGEPKNHTNSFRNVDGRRRHRRRRRPQPLQVSKEVTKGRQSEM